MDFKWIIYFYWLSAFLIFKVSLKSSEIASPTGCFPPIPSNLIWPDVGLCSVPLDKVNNFTPKPLLSTSLKLEFLYTPPFEPFDDKYATPSPILLVNLSATVLFAVLSISRAGGRAAGSGSYPHGGSPQRQREACVYPMQAGCAAGLNEGPDHR